MATKPSSVPTWNTDGDNNTEPSSGKKALGWEAGEQPPSSYFNWLQKLTGEWLQYLSDGTLTGAHSVSGAFSALSTLAVTGATTLTGALTAAAGTFSGLITASAGLTAAANQHVTVSGTGDFKHGDRTLMISVASAAFDANWTKDYNNGIASSSGAGSAMLAIPLRVGDRLKSVFFVCTGNTSADCTAHVMLQNAASTTNTDLGSATATNPTASLQTTPIDVTDTTIASGDSVYINFAANAASLSLWKVGAVYDRP